MTRYCVRHQPSGRLLGDRLERADGFLSRLRGLLGRAALGPGEGLILEGCSGIHTGFMRFPIDVGFLDASARVRRVARALPPWRVAAAPGSAHVIELAAGGLAGVEPGDLLEIVPCG